MVMTFASGDILWRLTSSIAPALFQLKNSELSRILMAPARTEKNAAIRRKTVKTQGLESGLIGSWTSSGTDKAILIHSVAISLAMSEAHEKNRLIITHKLRPRRLTECSSLGCSTLLAIINHGQPLEGVLTTSLLKPSFIFGTHWPIFLCLLDLRADIVAWLSGSRPAPTGQGEFCGEIGDPSRLGWIRT